MNSLDCKMTVCGGSLWNMTKIISFDDVLSSLLALYNYKGRNKSRFPHLN